MIMKRFLTPIAWIIGMWLLFAIGVMMVDAHESRNLKRHLTADELESYATQGRVPLHGHEYKDGSKGFWNLPLDLPECTIEGRVDGMGDLEDAHPTDGCYKEDGTTKDSNHQAKPKVEPLKPIPTQQPTETTSPQETDDKKPPRETDSTPLRDGYRPPFEYQLPIDDDTEDKQVDNTNFVLTYHKGGVNPVFQQEDSILPAATEAATDTPDDVEIIDVAYSDDLQAIVLTFKNNETNHFVDLRNDYRLDIFDSQGERKYQLAFKKKSERRKQRYLRGIPILTYQRNKARNEKGITRIALVSKEAYTAWSVEDKRAFRCVIRFPIKSYAGYADNDVYVLSYQYSDYEKTVEEVSRYPEPEAEVAAAPSKPKGTLLATWASLKRK